LRSAVEEARVRGDQRDIAICRFQLAKHLLEIEQFSEAEALLLAIQPAMERVIGPTDPHGASLLIELGRLYRVTGRVEESEKVLHRAVRTLESTPGTETTLTGRSLLELGTTYYAMGRHPQAIRVLSRGLPVFEKMPPQAESAQFWVNLGNVRFSVGQLKEAETAWRRALGVLDRLPDLQLLKAITLCYLGNLKLAQSHRAEAESLILEATAIAQAQQGHGKGLLPILHSLATLYASRGEFQGAEKTYGQALDIALATGGSRHPDTAVIFQSLGKLRTLEKRFDEAAALYERALESLEKSLGEQHPLYFSYLAEYTACLRKMNRTAEAKQLEARARAIRENNRIQTLAGDTVDVRELQRHSR